MKLRGRQAEVVDLIVNACQIAGNRFLVVCPTGFGKTVVANAITKALFNKRICFIVPRIQLVEQTREKFERVSSIYCAGLGEKKISDLTIATRQSIKDYSHFDVLIVDEVHMGSIPQSWENKTVIGLTATPFIGSRPIYGKGKFFERIGIEVSIKELIEQGYLAPYKLRSSKEKYDLSHVRIDKGEYVTADLEALNTELKIKRMVADLIKATADRMFVVVFCTTINHADKVYTELINQGQLALVKHSESDSSHFDKVKYAVSVGQLTTGWDFPKCDCVALMRPTRSTALAIQMIGRALRLHPDKTYARILDYGDVIAHCGTPVNPVIHSGGDKKKLENMVWVCKCLAYNHVNFTHCQECKLERPKPKRAFGKNLHESGEQKAKSAKVLQIIKRQINFTKNGKEYLYLELKLTDDIAVYVTIQFHIFDWRIRVLKHKQLKEVSYIKKGDFYELVSWN